MQYSPTLATVALICMLTGCGPDGGTTNASAADDEAAIDRERGRTDGSPPEALVISPRTYTSGQVTVKIAGFFRADGRQLLNPPASFTDDDQTWIQYGNSGAQELNVLFTNSTSQAENGVTVGAGPYTVTATSTSGECRPKINVSPTSVSGHFWCTGSTGYNKKTGEMGKVNIEVEFDATS